MDEKELEHKIDEYAERQVDVKVAYDGCSMEL